MGPIRVQKFSNIFDKMLQETELGATEAATREKVLWGTTTTNKSSFVSNPKDQFYFIDCYSHMDKDTYDLEQEKATKAKPKYT